jgi:hypothetical protein
VSRLFGRNVSSNGPHPRSSGDDTGPMSARTSSLGRISAFGQPDSYSLTIRAWGLVTSSATGTAAVVARGISAVDPETSRGSSPRRSSRKLALDRHVDHGRALRGAASPQWCRAGVPNRAPTEDERSKGREVVPDRFRARLASTRLMARTTLRRQLYRGARGRRQHSGDRQGARFHTAWGCVTKRLAGNEPGNGGVPADLLQQG